MLDADLRDLLGVFISYAIGAFVIGLRVRCSPPIAQVAILIELASLIIEAVSSFVSDYRSGSAVIHCVILFGIKEWRLQNSCGKINGVSLSVLVRIDCRRRHAPFRAIHRLADLLQLAMHLKRSRVLNIGKVVVRGNFQL